MIVNLHQFDITRGRQGDVPWGRTVFGSEPHHTGGKRFNKFGPTISLTHFFIFWSKYKQIYSYPKIQRRVNTCPKTPTVRLVTKRPSRWVNKLRLIGRIDEKNFLIFSAINIMRKWERGKNEDVWLRMLWFWNWVSAMSIMRKLESAWEWQRPRRKDKAWWKPCSKQQHPPPPYGSL